jgi:hypothetical protein
MKKMRLVYALALAGFATLNAHATPVAQDAEAGGDEAEIVVAVTSDELPTANFQPGVNVILSPEPALGFLNFDDGTTICACTILSNVDVTDLVTAEIADPGAAIPEPATLPLLGLGLAGIFAVCRKRQR